MAKDEEIIDVVIEGEDDDRPEAADDDENESSTQQNDAGSEADEDDESDVAAADDSATDDERESIRERRRKERHDRKVRAREREETLRRELSSRDVMLNELRQRLDVIDRRNTGSELAQLSNAKKQATEEYAYYKDQIRLGTESQNGSAVADATEKLYQTKSKLDQLNNIEKAMGSKQQATQPLDPRVANAARSWAEKNPWYDLQGKDQDSRVVLMLDQTLAEEGWNPSTPEYWSELNNRVKKYLPHRANRDTITNKQKSVVAGSGRESAPRSGGAVFRLSAERVKALKDANKWDDVAERNKMIKEYRDYDRNNANNEGAR